VIVRLFVSLLICLSSALATAQVWPTQPVKIVVPAMAGSSVDIVARLIGDKLAPLLGQPVSVENRAGGGGTLGTDSVAQSRDGHTLLLGYNGPLTVAPSLYPNLPYDTARDFTPVILAVTQPNALAVRSELKVSNLKEWLALVKSRPGKFDYASVGNGSLSHLAMEMLKARSGSFIVHLPLNGGPALTQALYGGEAQMGFSALANLLPLVNAGKVRLIAISNARRSSVAPNIPTVAEQGFPGFEATTWNGFLAPAGMPRPAVERLNKLIAQVLAMPDVEQRLLASGAEPAGGTPEQFADLIRSELAAWPAVVKRSGARRD
jgi:tripartite-type tricarboxylate transporter receptor subunit TctC